MAKELWLICDECGRNFDVDFSTARELWDLEEQGIDITCGNCPAVAREKDSPARERTEQ